MDNKAIVKRLIEEVWNKGNLAVVDELVAPNFVNHDPQLPQEMRNGRDGFKAHVKMNRDGAPDMRVNIDQLFEDGNHVIARWTVTGTNKGKYLGMNPTNRPVSVTGVTIQRIEAGKIAETWWAWDMLGLLQQLGFVPKTQDMAQQAGRGQQPRPEAK